jgi:uncharacterized protein YjbI with pentapeptide repeats
LEEASLERANLAESNLKRVSLAQTILSQTNLYHADLVGTNAEGIDFSSTQHLTLEQVKSMRDWEYATYSPELEQQLELL